MAGQFYWMIPMRITLKYRDSASAATRHLVQAADHRVHLLNQRRRRRRGVLIGDHHSPPAVHLTQVQ
jgi:hypothetical protein